LKTLEVAVMVTLGFLERSNILFSFDTTQTSQQTKTRSGHIKRLQGDFTSFVTKIKEEEITGRQTER
jgi:hypothetical protein